jgi:hypothetical protein
VSAGRAAWPARAAAYVLVESVEPSPPAVVLDAERSRLIDEELAPSLDRAFKRLGDAYRFVR